MGYNLRWYVLDDEGNPIVENDFMKWSEWRAANDMTIILQQIGNITVSTVFLAIDHDWRGAGTPVLFETMIFGGQFDQHTWRYTTKEDAVAGHAEAVSLVRTEFH